MYRVNVTTPHHHTGDKFKVYPLYDFACPIVDSLEGVTHALRSKEYNERIVLYKVIWEMACKGQKGPDGQELRLPNLQQFCRQEFVRNFLSKRKLAHVIETGRASGWDDPRLPTVQGIMRRGLTVKTLKDFAFQQGFSTRDNLQEWDKIWAMNAKPLNAKAPRYQAVHRDGVIPVRLSNVTNSIVLMTPTNPKDTKGAKKALRIEPTAFIHSASA